MACTIVVARGKDCKSEVQEWQEISSLSHAMTSAKILEAPMFTATIIVFLD